MAAGSPSWSTGLVEGAGDQPEPVLVVDGANVVGSRPDGWWRDRPGAAARLHSRLVAAESEGRVVLVLEGRARQGVREGHGARVGVVHAAGSGDDTIVEVAAAAASAGAATTVTTADRQLGDRIRAVGADTERPGRLLARLDAVETGPVPDPGPF